MTDNDFPPAASPIKSMTLDEYLAEMDPELRAAYPAFIPLFENWPHDAREARKFQAALMTKQPPRAGIAREDFTIPNRDASEGIPARLYSAARRGKSRGCVLLIQRGSQSRAWFRMRPSVGGRRPTISVLFATQ